MNYSTRPLSVLVPKEEHWHIHDAVDAGEALAIEAFKEGVSQPDRARAIKIAKAFQEPVLKIVKRSGPFQGQIVLDRSLRHAKQGANVVFDILDVDEVRSHPIAEQTQIKTVLVYCPFAKLTERLAERNRKALSGETGLNEVRAGTFPFIQYAELIRPKQSSDPSSCIIDQITKQEAIDAFEANFDAGIEILRKTSNGLEKLQKMEREKSIALRRSQEKDEFLESFGFIKSDPSEKTIEFVPRKEYDQFVDTSNPYLGHSPVERGHTAALRILGSQ